MTCACLLSPGVVREGAPGGEDRILYSFIPSCREIDMRKHALCLVLCPFLFLAPFLSAFTGPVLSSGSGSDLLTFHFSGEPLRTVLKTVSDRSGTGFVFQDDLVEGRKVSCSFENLSLDHALDYILSPLSISFKRIPSGPIVLYDAKTAERLIRGWVVDASSGNGLPFANIVQEGTSSGTTSDTDGSFVLRNSRSDSCTIRVSYIGYRPEQIRLQSAHRQDSIRIAMQERPIETKCMVVEADRIPDLEIAAHPGEIVFSPKKMDFIPSAEGNSFGRTIQLLPGAGAAFDRSYVPGFLGGTDVENLVLLDDIPLYKADTYYGWLSPLHPRMFEKVVVRKGGYPAPYGDRTGGIVELTGNTVPEKRFNAGAGADPFSANAFIEWPVSKKLRCFVAGRRSHDDIVDGRYYDGIKDFLLIQSGPSFSATVNDQKLIPRYRYTFSDLAGKISWDGDGKNRLNATGFVKKEKGRYHAGWKGEGIQIFHADEERLTNFGLSANWEHAWNRLWTSRFVAAFSRYSPVLEDASGDRSMGTTFYFIQFRQEGQDFETRMSRLENRLDFGRHAVDFGVEFVRKDFQLSQFGIPFTPFPQVDSGEMTRMAHDHARFSNTAVYIQENWSPWPVFGLSFGLRGIYSDFRDRSFSQWVAPGSEFTNRKERHFDSFLDPRLSARLSINDRLSARLAMGIYHQFERMGTSQDQERYPSMAPEWRWNSITGPGDESRQVILDLNYETGRFGLTMESYIRYDPDLLSFDYGTGSTRGVEWTARKKDGFLSGWISYRLNRSEYRLDRYPEDRSTAAYQDRRNEFKAVAACHLGSIRFSLVGCLASGKPYTTQRSMKYFNGEYTNNNGAFNGSRLPAYERVDLQVAKRFERLLSLNWEIGIALLNLFDRKNVLDREFLYDYQNLPSNQWVTPAVHDIPMLGFTPTATVSVTLN
jgi:ferric enterobactin receptor